MVIAMLLRHLAKPAPRQFASFTAQPNHAACRDHGWLLTTGAVMLHRLAAHLPT
jgi:hypothetical protein